MSNKQQDYYPEPDEPYFLKDDTGLGTCPECGSYLENWGAVSQGDGDMYDELGCPYCQETRGKDNQRWVDSQGNFFYDEESMWESENRYADDDDSLPEGEFE